MSVLHREEVRILLSLMDPEGVAMRKHHRINRRIYSSKVLHVGVAMFIAIKTSLHVWYLRFAAATNTVDIATLLKSQNCQPRVLTTAGISMAMTN